MVQNFSSRNIAPNSILKNDCDTDPRAVDSVVAQEPVSQIFSDFDLKRPERNYRDFSF